MDQAQRIVPPNLADYLRHLRRSSNLGDSRRLRSKKPGMTRAQLAVSSGLSTGYVTKLEQGHADNPSVEVVQRLCEALEIGTAERQHLFDLARQVAPPAEPDSELFAGAARETITQEQIDALERLNPHTCSFVDHHWNILYANSECTRMFRGLVDVGNMLLWMFGSDQAPKVMVEWDLEAGIMVAWLRSMFARRPDDEKFHELLQSCARNPAFVTHWESQRVAAGRRAPRLRLRDLDTGEVHDIIAQLWPSADPSQPINFYLGIRTDVAPPPDGPRPTASAKDTQ